MLGLLDGFSTAPVVSNTGLWLSDACMHFWIFLATYVNLKTPSDQYSTSVDRILEKLNFEETKFLVRMQIPSGTFKNVQTVNWDHSELTIDHYANIFCKFIFHKYFHFAGMYDFTPPSSSSILVHRGRNNASALVLATQKNFSMEKPAGVESDGSWMFDPTTSVRDRSDYTIEEKQVVFKFMTNRLDYEREVKWREEFSEENKINDGILCTLTTFDPNCIDGEVDKKYAVDRLNKRFKLLPLHSKVVQGNLDDTIDLTKYPYAVVFPFAAGGTLQDVVSRGSMELNSIKRAAYQMGMVLSEFHDIGLIHGSFSLRNIFSFLDKNGGIVEKHLKVGGLASVTPVDQNMFSLGAITPGGKCLFDSSSLPPEMFMKVNATELQDYNLYWKVVMELDYVNVPAEMVKPRIDPITNEAYIMKCYCNLDGRSAEALPILPYNLVQYDESIDVWAFGVFLFNLVSGGETIFQPNSRTGRFTAMEFLAKWDIDIAESIIFQYVSDLAAQDILLHILVKGEKRKNMTLKTILAHPFFSASDPSDKVEEVFTKARNERGLMHKVRRKQQENDKTLEKDIKPTYLGRLELKTQLRLTNSATEALRECFDPNCTFTSNAPFTFMLLPYELVKNEKGRLVPKSTTEMELAHRLGRQLLELAKAVGFAACYSETLITRSDKFQNSIARLFLNPDSDPIQIGKDVLSTFMLDGDDYFDIVTKFVIIVIEEIENDPDSFINDPMSPIHKLVLQYATGIVDTFAITNRAFLYLVDEYSCTIAMGGDGPSPYPHAFRDHLADIVYKSLPYMHTCVSSVSCTEEGPRGLLKLLAEGNYPNVPDSWESAISGVPTVPIRRRMVAEAKILHEATHNMIDSTSPIALNKEAEMQFLTSLYLHIDSACNYAGLHPITDGAGTMWVTESSRIRLLEESAQESKPERVYESYAREEAEFEKMEEKERKIAQLEKALRKTQKEMEKIRVDI
jgi:serine/threonine protein kinase